MPSPNTLAIIVSEISAFIRTDGHGWIDSANDPDQEHIVYLLVTYFTTDLVYPLTLRVTGIKIC